MNKYHFKTSGIVFLLAVYSQIIAQNVTTLDEFTVIADRIRNTATGYTVNLKNSPVTKGKTLPQTIEFLPQLSIENGIYKIAGNPVSEFYIDNIKIIDPTELHNIQGADIDKIEIKYVSGSDSDNPSVGGSISIILRKPPQGGYYGSISGNADWRKETGFGNEGIGGMIRYRYKSIGIYDNISWNHIKTDESSMLNGESEKEFWTQDNHKETLGHSFQNRINISADLKNGQYIGGAYLISLGRLNPVSSVLSSQQTASIDEDNSTTTQQATVKFKSPLDVKKRTYLDISGDYLNRLKNVSEFFINDSQNLNTTEKKDFHLWKLHAEIGYAHSSRVSWKFGGTIQYIRSFYRPSTHSSIQYDMTGNPYNASGVSGNAFASAQGSLGIIKYNAGLNWQNNRINYMDCKSGLEVHNSQWALNPTLQLMMPFGMKGNVIMINYRRNLANIPYSAISSTITWRDNYNYSIGNPHLKAPTTDMLLAGISFLKNKINLAAVYAHSHNQIFWQTFEDMSRKDTYYTCPINLSGRDKWGFNVEYIDSSSKFWRFKLAGRVEISPERMTLDNIRYNSTRFKEFFYFNNDFSFPNQWGSMLYFNIEPTFKDFNRTYHYVYSVTGNIYKRLCKGKLRISVNFTALGNRRKLVTDLGSTILTYRYTSPVQRIGVSAVWSFSGGKKVKINTIESIQEFEETIDND